MTLRTREEDWNDLPRAGSLNANPHNLRAEELALDECMRGLRVRHRWSEQEMVCSFGGGEVPGTPDGMFEDAAGALTCVQVVRVPLLPGMDAGKIRETIYDTVLTKVLKSQTWMRSTRIMPRDFIIFGWLPPLRAEASRRATRAHARLARIARHVGLLELTELDCAVPSKALIRGVRHSGWPFHLKLAAPGEPEAIFPSRFAAPHAGKRDHAKVSEADLVALNLGDFEGEGDDEPVEWDLFAPDDASERGAVACDPRAGGAPPLDDDEPVEWNIFAPDGGSEGGAAACDPRAGGAPPLDDDDLRRLLGVGEEAQAGLGGTPGRHPQWAEEGRAGAAVVLLLCWPCGEGAGSGGGGSGPLGPRDARKGSRPRHPKHAPMGIRKEVGAAAFPPSFGSPC